jgi:Uncharacterized protein conserved in bacteria (DUF2188)
MAESGRRDVVPSKGDKSGCDVTQPRSKRPVSHHRTQANAEKAAKRDLAGKGGGEVAIHRPDGSIRDKDTVKPAKDPFPPRDKRH